MTVIINGVVFNSVVGYRFYPNTLLIEVEKEAYEDWWISDRMNLLNARDFKVWVHNENLVLKVPLSRIDNIECGSDIKQIGNLFWS